MASYTSPKRVERDGFLIAFEGETMTETEARKRGLLGATESAPMPSAPPSNDGEDGEKKLSKAEIMAKLESLGISYKKNAKVDDLRALLAEAEANEGEGENPEADAEANEGEGN